VTFLRFTSILFAFALVASEVKAAPVNFYTYGVSETLPCNAPACPTNSNITLQGTITTNSLGTLTSSNIVVWDLAITLTGQQAIRLTQNSGFFSTVGSPQIAATAQDLTLTTNSSSDGFIFGGSQNAPASWFYGPSQAEILSYNDAAGNQFTAQQLLSFPSTFTAAAVSSTAAPEPASLFLSVAAGLLLFALGLTRRRKLLVASSLERSESL
jgi:hypothetical protein